MVGSITYLAPRALPPVRLHSCRTTGNWWVWPPLPCSKHTVHTGVQSWQGRGKLYSRRREGWVYTCWGGSAGTRGTQGGSSPSLADWGRGRHTKRHSRAPSPGVLATGSPCQRGPRRGVAYRRVPGVGRRTGWPLERTCWEWLGEEDEWVPGRERVSAVFRCCQSCMYL